MSVAERALLTKIFLKLRTRPESERRIHVVFMVMQAFSLLSDPCR